MRPKTIEQDPGWIKRKHRQIDAELARIRATRIPVADSTPPAYRRVTAATTVTLDDDTVSVDATAGSVSVTLPRPVTCVGQHFTVKKWDTAPANAVTVVGAIDGATNYTLTGALRPSVTVVSNGTGWEVI